jgi:hypothetical protein
MKNMIGFDSNKSIIEMTKAEWQKSTGETIDDAAAQEAIDAYANLLLYLLEAENVKNNKGE